MTVLYLKKYAIYVAASYKSPDRQIGSTLLHYKECIKKKNVEDF